MQHYLIDVRFYDDYNVGSKKYTYKVPHDVHIDINDDVIVHVASSTKDRKNNVAKVVDINKESQDHEFKLKWIVQKIDDVSYRELCDKEREYKALVNKLMNRKQNKSIIEQLAEVADETELAKLKSFFN